VHLFFYFYETVSAAWTVDAAAGNLTVGVLFRRSAVVIVARIAATRKMLADSCDQQQPEGCCCCWHRDGAEQSEDRSLKFPDERSEYRAAVPRTGLEDWFTIRLWSGPIGEASRCTSRIRESDKDTAPQPLSH